MRIMVKNNNNDSVRKKWLSVLLMLCMIFVFAVPITGAVEYPVLTEHITDNAGIINAEYRQKIGDLLNRMEAESTVEVAVLTIKSLDGEDKSVYATEVGHKSGIGKGDVDNGLLMLIAMDDGLGTGKGAYFVATGYGLEGTLPDATVFRINEEVLLPYLKKGKETGDITYYGQGIYEEMLVFEGLFTNNSDIVSKYSNSGSTGEIGDIGTIGWIIFIIIIIVVILFFIALVNSGGGGSSGGWSSGGSDWSSGGSSGESSSSHGFGGGGFGGGGSGGGFKRATGNAASSTSSTIRRRSSSSSSSSNYSSSHRGSSISRSHGFGRGGFGGGGSGGGF